MGNSQYIFLLSYGILEEFDSKTFEKSYPSFVNYVDEDFLLDDIVTALLNQKKAHKKQCF